MTMMPNVVFKMCDEVVYALKKTIRLKSENYFHGQNDETYPPHHKENHQK